MNDRIDFEKLAKTVCLQYPKINLVILYGSFAEGKETAKSDIDLAIASSLAISAEDRVEIALAVSKMTDREVDVIDLNRANGVLLREILIKGKVLLKNDSEIYHQLLKKHLYYQADFMPLLNMILTKRRKKFIHES